MHTVDPTPIPPRREIITDYLPPCGGTVRAFDQAPAEGDIHHATTVAIAVAQTKAERQALDVQIAAAADTFDFPVALFVVTGTDDDGG